MVKAARRRNATTYGMKKYKKPFIGVYQIRCVRNNKVFIRAALDCERRLNNDITALISGIHKCVELQKDFTTYGRADFRSKVVIRYNTVLYTKKKGEKRRVIKGFSLTGTHDLLRSAKASVLNDVPIPLRYNKYSVRLQHFAEK